MDGLGLLFLVAGFRALRARLDYLSFFVSYGFEAWIGTMFLSIRRME